MKPVKRATWAIGFFAVGFGLFAAGGLRADGFIVPHPPRPGDAVPPLSVKYHHVIVEIADQVAKTSVDQVFLNHLAAAKPALAKYFAVGTNVIVCHDGVNYKIVE